MRSKREYPQSLSVHLLNEELCQQRAVVFYTCLCFSLCRTDTLLLPGGSDPLHALQMEKRRQREKGNEAEKFASRANFFTFFFLSGLTIVIPLPRASASLMNHWHLSE